MQIRLTDVSMGTLIETLIDRDFGLVTTTSQPHGVVETVAIWTETTNNGPGGYEVGLIRRELASFARYEMILETDRIPDERLVPLLAQIIRRNR